MYLDSELSFPCEDESCWSSRSQNADDQVVPETTENPSAVDLDVDGEIEFEYFTPPYFKGQKRLFWKMGCMIFLPFVKTENRFSFNPQAAAPPQLSRSTSTSPKPLWPSSRPRPMRLTNWR